MLSSSALLPVSLFEPSDQIEPEKTKEEGLQKESSIINILHLGDVFPHTGVLRLSNGAEPA